MARKGSYKKWFEWMFDHIHSKTIRFIVFILISMVVIPLSIIVYALRSIVELCPTIINESRNAMHDVVHWNE